MTDAHEVAAGLWSVTGGSPGALERVAVRGAEHVLPSSFAVTAAATGVIAAATLAAGDYAGFDGAVTLDTGQVAVVVRSESYVRIVGDDAPVLWNQVAGDYPTTDGWIRLHTNYPHHRRAALGVLDRPAERDAVAAAVRTWEADALEAAIVAAGGCAATMHTLDEWAHYDHGRRVTERPVVAVEQIGEAPARQRPLDELRVLDVTRVIAGPVASRFLAGWGADVLRVEAPVHVDTGIVALDVGFGKRSCALDLRVDADRRRFEALVADADVVVHGYRPGALAQLGYGPDALTALRPGLVVASLSAYGLVGPWAGRRGFDSLVQMSGGIAAEGMRVTGADRPVPLPCQLLDHGAGYLLAFGVLRALCRQRTAGGSWSVEASLARTAAWLDGLGRVDALDVTPPSPEDAARWCETTTTPWGEARHARAPGLIGEQAPRYRRPPSWPGTDPPEW